MLSRRDLLLSTPLALKLSSRAATFDVPRRSVKVRQAFRSPGPKPNGLQATAEGLWILDQGDNRAYLVTYDGGRVLRALETESKAGSGITFDGEALWLASTYSCEIIRADARSGKTLAKYPSPGAGPVAWTQGRTSPLAAKTKAPSPPAPQGPPKAPSQRQPTGAHGLEWRDGKLYLANPPSQKIYRMDVASWKLEFSFATAGDRPHGIGWEGQWLWCTDSNHNAFYQHDPATGRIHEAIQLADNDPLPHGMTIWKNEMWYCDDVGVVCKFVLR